MDKQIVVYAHNTATQKNKQTNEKPVDVVNNGGEY